MDFAACRPAKCGPEAATRSNSSTCRSLRMTSVPLSLTGMSLAHEERDLVFVEAPLAQRLLAALTGIGAAPDDLGGGAAEAGRRRRLARTGHVDEGPAGLQVRVLRRLVELEHGLHAVVVP